MTKKYDLLDPARTLDSSILDNKKPTFKNPALLD